MCADAVGYCQVLDAISPNSGLQLQKLNLNTKNKDDKERNLRIFAAHLKKMKLNFAVDVANIANGKF